jgi:NTE family protein
MGATWQRHCKRGLSLSIAAFLVACAAQPRNAPVVGDWPAPELGKPVVHDEAGTVRPGVEPTATWDARDPAAPPAVEAPIPIPPPRIALALGGGAAKGFAHVGVIKALEAAGIIPDIIVGSSAGSIVGALYASGISATELQRIALSLEESAVSDWTLPSRGFIKGESLQNFINAAVQNRPIEKMPRTLGVVATDLQSGEMIVFRRGNTGMAVRASSSVPGVFQPVAINNREYVDGVLTSPVPVMIAREMGADIVIAIDISSPPSIRPVQDSLDVLVQAFSIMGRVISAQELPRADVVVRPDVSHLALASFESRRSAIAEGEKAGLATVPQIKARIARFYELKKGRDEPF